MLAACRKSDIGTPCATQASTPLNAPVVGENPSLASVLVTRDSACESTQCLSESGISPYCTRTCSATSHSDSACTQHSDCPRGQFCENGLCHTHTCPEGFYCQTPQPAGSLSQQRFCMRQRGCSTDASCNNLGELYCRPQACYDTCLTNNACSAHTLQCSSADTVSCTCSQPNTSVAT
jgi:hypothetical protein